MKRALLGRLATAVLAVAALTSAYILETRETTRALESYREAGMTVPNRPDRAAPLPASAFHGERDLPLTAIDEDPDSAIPAAARYGWLLLGSEAMLDGTDGSVDLGDQGAFDLARLDTALAVSAHAMATHGRPVDATKRYAATVRLAAALRERGSEVDLLLGSALLDRTLHAITRDRAALDEAELGKLSNLALASTPAIFERMRLAHAQSVVSWLDDATADDRFWVRGPIRDEIALDALRSFDADMDVAAAAWERGATSCSGGLDATALCARFEKLRATDAAWAAFHASVKRTTE